MLLKEKELKKKKDLEEKYLNMIFGIMCKS